MGALGKGYTTPAPQLKELNRIAQRTRNLKNEQYRIVDTEGNVLLTKQGGKGEVATTIGEKRQYLGGNIGIHNHPEGGTFSSADLRAFAFGAVESWVAAPEGTYKLINTRVGKDDQYRGWHAMQEALENSDFYKKAQDASFITLRDEAAKAPQVKKLSDYAQTLSQEWVRRRDAGASQEELKKLSDKWDEVNNQYKTALRAQMRHNEVNPYHEFYKKNASKYGFKYVFEPKKKKS